MALISGVPMPEPPSTLGFNGAFLVVWHIAGSKRQIWFAGHSGHSSDFLSGKSSFRGPKILRGPYHSLQFHLPRSAIKHLVPEDAGRTTDDHCNRIGIALRDPVIDDLGREVLHASFARNALSSTFLDRILHVLFARVASACSLAETLTPQPIGLAAWQERRAEELLNVGGANVSLRRLADECGLSVSQFIRAFRKSTGLPPRRWQLRMRMERAKNLMMQSETPLSQVALDCGFADQSHFTRAFARAIGATPSAWRKAHQSGSEGSFPCVDLCDREQNELLAQVVMIATRGTARTRSGGTFEPTRVDRHNIHGSVADARTVRSPRSPVGGDDPCAPAARGGLAPWQERRVKALMTANLATDLSLKRLADECDLSVTQFARAFRRSTGKPPHHWLLECRVEAALSMLAGSRARPRDIASRCGFANQSHFTRTFANKIGMAPSAWRRLHGNGPVAVGELHATRQSRGTDKKLLAMGN
jgi:AraC family transcriptional regulator